VELEAPVTTWYASSQLKVLCMLSSFGPVYARTVRSEAVAAVLCAIRSGQVQPTRSVVRGMGTNLRDDVDAPGAYPVSPSHTIHDTRGVSQTALEMTAGSSLHLNAALICGDSRWGDDLYRFLVRPKGTRFCGSVVLGSVVLGSVVLRLYSGGTTPIVSSRLA